MMSQLGSQCGFVVLLAIVLELILGGALLLIVLHVIELVSKTDKTHASGSCFDAELLANDGKVDLRTINLRLIMFHQIKILL
jgi:hypothetical protein